jgi:hypothetical protein
MRNLRAKTIMARSIAAAMRSGRITAYPGSSVYMMIAQIAATEYPHIGVQPMLDALRQEAPFIRYDSADEFRAIIRRAVAAVEAG